MKRREYSMKDMKRSDWTWQLLIVAEVAVMAVALVLGIDMGDGRANLRSLAQALLGNGDVKSEMWLWVARISVVDLVLTVIWYKIGPEKKNHG